MTTPITLPNGRKIGEGEPCFVVAEIGQNHQGDAYTALRLMKAAHEAGVDAIKLCKRHVPSDLTRAARDAPYPGPQSFGATYGEHREALELSLREYAHFRERLEYNEWPEILFATVCDQHSVDDVKAALDPPLYKIASRDLDNLPLLDYVARLGKPMVLSTGMAEEYEIRIAIEVIRAHHDQIVVLHCTSEYPTPNQHVGLQWMAELRDRYEVLVGLSDHTPGIVAAQAAATLGAVMVEKHITLARAMKGSDHAASLEPEGIRRLVRNIRAVDAMRVTPSTSRQALADAKQTSRAKLGRSLVSRRTIEPGETITEEMLCLKSPGDGIRWGQRAQVIDRRSAVWLQEDTTIQMSDLLPKDAVVINPGDTLVPFSPEWPNGAKSDEPVGLEEMTNG
jgi:sialic acid synthase SpsE